MDPHPDFLMASSLNSILLQDDAPPEWIELLPPGPFVQGRDGRSWKLSDPSLVLDAFSKNNKPIPIDWEHATEIRAPQGLDAPAAGWIDRIELRDGAIWGHAQWTKPAIEQITAKQYRYVSPVFLYSKDSKEILALDSVGLTNRPNLVMTAINSQHQDIDMIPESILKALNIPPDSDEKVVIVAVNKLQSDLAELSKKAEMPPLEKFVPRADHDALIARAENAEKRIAEIEKSQQKSVIDALIDSALNKKQIVPATADYYRSMCATIGGIEAFKAFCEKAPALLSESGLNKKPIQTETPEAEFAANASLQAEFGDVETYKAYIAAANSGKAVILGSKAR